MVLDRITRNSEVMGGKPCVRGMRVMRFTTPGTGVATVDIVNSGTEEDIHFDGISTGGFLVNVGGVSYQNLPTYITISLYDNNLSNVSVNYYDGCG